MRPYVVQSFKGILGQTESSWLIDPISRNARVTEIPGTDVTIRPEPGVTYHCGELASLAVVDSPAIGSYLIAFTSGSTATVLTIPASIAMPDNYQVTANTRYEISVQDGFALCAGWAVRAS